MKTQMKKTAIAITMIIAFCGTVKGQQYEIAVRNDAKTTWVSGGGLTGNPVINYRNSSISGIGGDTIYMRMQNSSSSVEDVSYWEIVNENTTPASTDTVYSSDSIFYVLPKDTIEFKNRTITITAYKTDGTNAVCVLFPKFLPPTILIADGSKNTSKELTLADFNIYINPSLALNSAYSDSIYWYKNGALIPGITDTSYTTTENGEYSVKVKIVYINKVTLTDSCVYVRWELSDTVTVSNITLTEDGIYYSNGGNEWTMDYKSPNISGIAGENILIRYNASDTIRKVIWKNVDLNTLMEIAIDTSEFISLTIPQNTDTLNIKVYDSTGVLVEYFSIFPKHTLSNFELISYSANIVSDTLVLSNFNVDINYSAGGYKAYYDSISWYRNDTIIQGVTDTLYVANSNGNYYVILYIVFVNVLGADTIKYGRVMVSNTVIVSNIDTYIENYSNDGKFSVYPIPTHNSITIEQPLSENTMISIFNIMGELVLQKKMETAAQQIDLSNIPNGSYIIQVKSNDKTVFGKIVKL